MGAELNIYLNHSLPQSNLWVATNAITNDVRIKESSLSIRKYQEKHYQASHNYEYYWEHNGSETFDQFTKNLIPAKRGVFFPEVSNGIVRFRMGRKGVIISTFERYGKFVEDFNVIELYRPLVFHVASMISSETSIYYPNSHWLAQCIDELVWLGKDKDEIETWLNENNVRKSPTVAGIQRFIFEEIIADGLVKTEKYSDLDAYYQEQITPVPNISSPPSGL